MAISAIFLPYKFILTLWVQELTPTGHMINLGPSLEAEGFFKWTIVFFKILSDCFYLFLQNSFCPLNNIEHVFSYFGTIPWLRDPPGNKNGT